MKIFLLACCFLSSSAFAEWKLVWSDEFDKPGLPDSAKWTYEEGLVRNKESQAYMKARKENARVESGCLVIEALKEKVKNPLYVSNDDPDWRKNRQFSDYSSACIISDGLASWKYGKIELRAKLPVKQGAWPAFWMMGADRSTVGWPKCGEIDIMEYVASAANTVFGTVHWPKGNAHQSKGETAKCDNLTEWHTYGIEWDADKIIWLFDGKPYGAFPLKAADGSVPESMGDGGNCFRKPYYLMINLAVGGAWGGSPDPAVFPQKLLVDYVRVYEKN